MLTESLLVNNVEMFRFYFALGDMEVYLKISYHRCFGYSQIILSKICLIWMSYDTPS